MNRAVGGGGLTGIRACVFDAYGTLFDVASAAAACTDSLGPKAAPLAALWRDKQLQYTWLRSLQNRYVDFAQVTADSLDFALEALAIGDDGLRSRLLDLYTQLTAYPDAAETLRRLRAAGLATAILSNGAPDMLGATVRHAGLSGLLDAVLSVDSVGIYKPAPRVYQMALDRFGVPADAICFVSANGWDAAGAAAFGMRVVWCNRTGQPAERLPGVPAAVIGSLAELPTLLAAAA